jgi:hypothetical protein
MYPLEKAQEASCASPEIDSKLTVKPLKIDEKVSTSEHKKNRPKETEMNAGGHRARTVVSPFFFFQWSRQSSESGLHFSMVAQKEMGTHYGSSSHLGKTLL